MFKHFLTACLVVLLSTVHMHALKPEDVPVPDGMVTGFIGAPLLKSTGWKAERGAFDINLGIETSDYGLLTDDDPENYWEATGLAQLTVAFSEFLKFVPDTDFQGERMSVKSGDRFGFVLASDGAAFDVLALDLVKMFCFNFYKDGSIAKTVNASHDELDVLGLGLINVQLGDKGQQVSIDVPYIDGQEVEFDGIGLSVAGVDVNVVNQLRVNYAYIDSFEEVPLIKKYFPHLTAKSDGMTSGAKYLIDNNLTNGASTAVLNIGGAYYTVMNNEPFPGGIEFGFHITAGTVLDLDLGKAMKIAALTYPLDANQGWRMKFI